MWQHKFLLKALYLLFIYDVVDGGFSQWSKWSACSKSCNRGTQERTRKCNSPVPMHGGRSCDGETYGTQRCKIKDCPGNYIKFNF